MKKPSTAWLAYPEDAGEGRVTNHACPIFLESDITNRIHTTYGVLPKEVKHLPDPLWLDTGGMVLLDMPWHEMRLPRGYSVRFKEEHAALLAGYILQRLDDKERIRTYGGVPCVTLYQRFWIIVLPVDDAQRIVKKLKKVGVEGHPRALARRAELIACGAIVDENAPKIPES